MSEGYRADYVMIDEAQDFEEGRLLELLQECIPQAPTEVEAQPLTAADIYKTIDEMRRSTVPDMPTWVMPVGVHVDASVPAHVVHSPLVGPDHFVIIPADAFGTHPLDA